jgi:hypothetical protein
MLFLTTLTMPTCSVQAALAMMVFPSLPNTWVMLVDVLVGMGALNSTLVATWEEAEPCCTLLEALCPSG